MALAKVIAVDFDGTLCMENFPDMGAPRMEVINKVLEEQKKGTKFILWTCREGKELQMAVDWCKEFGIFFDAINENIPERVAAFGTDPRKVGADEYWDDKAISFA